MFNSSILTQLAISSWDMVPRKYAEMNNTVAAWLDETPKSLPQLIWYGADSKEKGSDGFITGHKKSVTVAIIHVNCHPLCSEIEATIYHELLHYYRPGKDEMTISLYERVLVKSLALEQAESIEHGEKHKERIIRFMASRA